jgi:hypothetical protein
MSFHQRFMIGEHFIAGTQAEVRCQSKPEQPSTRAAGPVIACYVAHHIHKQHSLSSQFVFT